MKLPLQRPATVDGLFLWVLHRFADAFADHAIVKGGIALRLLECPRSTTDIDYVFVPFDSKKDVAPRLEEILREIDDAEVDVQVHSKMIRARLRVDDAAIQVEVAVDRDCPSTALPTGALATSQGQPSRLVRVVSTDVALASKLAAWNERRLLRDLYDVYFLVVRLGARPDRPTLEARLSKIESRLPALKRRRSMDLTTFVSELRSAVQGIDEDQVRQELAPVLPAEELPGLVPRIRSGVVRAIELLEVG